MQIATSVSPSGIISYDIQISGANPEKETYEQQEKRISAIVESLRTVLKEEVKQDCNKEISRQKLKKRINISQIAQDYQLPHSRLIERWNGKKSRLGWPSTQNLLTHQEEMSLCHYAKRCDEIGIPVTRSDLTAAANSIFVLCVPEKLRHSVRHSVPVLVVGPNWTSRFISRHKSQLKIVKHKSIDHDRKAAADYETIEKWFGLLKKEIEEFDIQPDVIYNKDDVTIQVPDHLVIPKPPLFLQQVCPRILGKP